MITRCTCKFCSTRNHVNHSVQIGEVFIVICLHEFSWLNAFWLDAEIYTVDVKLSELFYIKFSSLNHEYIFCYEIVKTCYVYNAEHENQPTHSFMKKHSGNYYSINDCLVNELTKIIIKLILLDYNFIVKERNHLSCCNS